MGLKARIKKIKQKLGLSKDKPKSLPSLKVAAMRTCEIELQNMDAHIRRCKKMKKLYGDLHAQLSRVRTKKDVERVLEPYPEFLEVYKNLGTQMEAIEKEAEEAKSEDVHVVELDNVKPIKKGDI